MSTRALIANTFNRHDFEFCWSHAEMATLVPGAGYDWAIRQTAEDIQELLDLTDSETCPSGSLPLQSDPDSTDRTPPPVIVTCKSADGLDHIPDSSVDAVVVDLPYYDNVMYAEQSDFFIGTLPSRGSVRSVCRKISALMEARYGLLPATEVVGRLNRVLLGWANYFCLGQASPAYAAIDAHASKRLRQWLCRRHKVKSGKYVRFPDERLCEDYGLARLKVRKRSFA